MPDKTSSTSEIPTFKVTNALLYPLLKLRFSHKQSLLAAPTNMMQRDLERCRCSTAIRVVCLSAVQSLCKVDVERESIYILIAPFIVF